ncbi:MAG: FHA domain-containing protein [Phototrophicaceae bacterium]
MNKYISITFMSGPLDGKILRFSQPPIGTERVIAIGRREGCDVEIDFDNQVSRLHAYLVCDSVPVTTEEGEPSLAVLSFWLEDLESRNGTYLHQQSQPIQGRVSVQAGDMFRIGRTWMRLDVPFSFDTTF